MGNGGNQNGNSKVWKGWPNAIRGLGFVIAVFSVIFWAFTGRLEPLFLAFAVTCLGLGEGLDALKEFKGR